MSKKAEWIMKRYEKYYVTDDDSAVGERKGGFGSTNN